MTIRFSICAIAMAIFCAGPTMAEETLGYSSPLSPDELQNPPLPPAPPEEEPLYLQFTTFMEESGKSFVDSVEKLDLSISTGEEKAASTAVPENEPAQAEQPQLQVPAETASRNPNLLDWFLDQFK